MKMDHYRDKAGDLRETFWVGNLSVMIKPFGKDWEWSVWIETGRTCNSSVAPTRAEAIEAASLAAADFADDMRVAFVDLACRALDGDA